MSLQFFLFSNYQICFLLSFYSQHLINQHSVDILLSIFFFPIFCYVIGNRLFIKHMAPLEMTLFENYTLINGIQPTKILTCQQLINQKLKLFSMYVLSFFHGILFPRCPWIATTIYWKWNVSSILIAIDHHGNCLPLFYFSQPCFFQNKTKKKW